MLVELFFVVLYFRNLFLIRRFYLVELYGVFDLFFVLPIVELSFFDLNLFLQSADFNQFLQLDFADLQYKNNLFHLQTPL